MSNKNEIGPEDFRFEMTNLEILVLSNILSKNTNGENGK